ncbi:MAG: ABC-2 family transporter protein [Bacillus subtilis]|nr:ABC-2 family transporter protein [Bacillus subtilis]
MNRFKKYVPFLRASIMQMFIYRGTVWLWLIVDVFQFVMMIFLWKSVYQFNDSINGFAFSEMLLYFLLTNVFFMFTDVEAIYAVSEEVREGRISMYMVKPISYRLRLYVELLGRALGILMLLLPIAIATGAAVIVIFDIAWTVSFGQIFVSMLYIPLIFTLMFSFAFFFGTVSIYTTNVFGVSIFASVFARVVCGQLVPIALYPPFLLYDFGDDAISFH